MPNTYVSLPSKNYLLNGNFSVAQIGTSGTVLNSLAQPTQSSGYYASDCWYAVANGGTPTIAQVAGAGSLYALQLTGAASVSNVYIAQRIEKLNTDGLAGSTVSLSLQTSNSLLTTVSWAAYYATTTNTFGTVGTPTKTSIASGNFTVTATLAAYTVSFAVPAAATTGIEIVFSVGAQVSGTWVLQNVKLEANSFSTQFVPEDYSQNLAKCLRYFYKGNPSMVGVVGHTVGSVTRFSCNHPVEMSIVPILTKVDTLYITDGTMQAGLSSIATNLSTTRYLEFDGIPTANLTRVGDCAKLFQSGGSISVFANTP